MSTAKDKKPRLRVVETNAHGVTVHRPPGTRLGRMVAEMTAAMLDDPSDADRDWFEAHPGEYYRRRPSFPGEELMTDVPPGWRVSAVDVWQIGPGIRIRHFLIAPDSNPPSTPKRQP